MTDRIVPAFAYEKLSVVRQGTGPRSKWIKLNSGVRGIRLSLWT
jgi:hypothetical protein